MYKTKKMLSALFAMTLALTLCACGGKSSDAATPETTSESTVSVDTGKEESVAAVSTAAATPKAELPVTGEYTLFALTYEGYLIRASEMDAESMLTLADGSTGTISMKDDIAELDSWTADAGTLTVSLADGTSAKGTVDNGIIILDLYGDESMLLYYAQDEADISGFALMTAEEVRAALENRVPESKIAAFWSGLDTAAGIHMSYDMHTEYMDATQSIDSYGKGDKFYSYKITRVSGYEAPSIVVFRDETAYNLDPEKKTGVVATTTSGSTFSQNVMLLDNLYNDIWAYAHSENFTEETREIDGVTYDVEYFPAGENTSECTFYFDESGRLFYIEKGAPVIEELADIGESTYTINAIDTEVDETLFDISGYEITE